MPRGNSSKTLLAPPLSMVSFCILPLLLCNLLLLTATAKSLVEANQIKSETASEQDFEELGLHYGRYLKEVVAALDKDQKFTETIKNMDSNDIKSGKVAEQLKHVHADIRKKLNDIKYLEVQRLRDLATRKNELETSGETYHGTDKRKWRTLGASLSQLPEHLGSHGTYFDVDDLHKLMVAATNDLEKLDKERKEDYKTYEMEKEWQFQERLKMMNETEKQEAIRLRQQLKDKHNDHAKVHEPGTKRQFEEVWEKNDKLPKAEFDPKVFFSLHDTNSDNHWDQTEVRRLLETEISKMYDQNNPEDDPNEMEEEYERMREHVYKEIDTDRDGLISRKEFIDYSQRPEFNKDNGWEDVNKKEAYSRQDYDEYTRNREKMLHNMHGHYDPTYYANQPNNFHLPDWGLGMPAGANPSHYYQYVDPNHPQAQQILAQQQHLAYQQQQAAAFHQGAAYQQAMPQQAYQHPQANQPYYQQAPQAQVGGQFQKPAVPQQQAQVGYQQPPPQQQQQQQQQQVPQAAPIQQPVLQQQQQQQQQQPAVPQQGQQAQANYQQANQYQQQQQKPLQPQANFQQQQPQQVAPQQPQMTNQQTQQQANYQQNPSSYQQQAPVQAPHQ